MLTPALQRLVDAQQHHGEILKQCANWINQGNLKIHLGQTFPLEKAADAHQTLENGLIMGKTALLIGEYKKGETREKNFLLPLLNAQIPKTFTTNLENLFNFINFRNIFP